MAETLSAVKSRTLRGYRVTVEKITVVETLKFPLEHTYQKITEGNYGYVENPNSTPDVETDIVKTLIYEQTVEELDIAHVALVVNGLGNSAKATVTSS